MEFILIQWIVMVIQIAVVHGTQFNESLVTTALKVDIIHAYDMHVVPFQISSSGVNVDQDHTHSFRIRNKATHFQSIDTDYHRQMFYFYDSSTSTIFSMDNFTWDTQFQDMTISVIHQGVSNAFVKLAVDWISNNIYWTDPLFKWIAVKSLTRNETFYKILIKDDLGYPLGIAVDPVHYYLFWGDCGPNPMIERSGLDGRDRKTVVSQGILYPIAMDVDQTLEKIVWVDERRDTIETANFDGTGRRIIRRMSHTTFFDIAVFQGVIFVVDFDAGRLHIVDRNTGEEDAGGWIHVTDGSLLSALCIFASSVQPSQTNYCEDSLCSDICVGDPSGPVCLCKEGYTLGTDAQTCIEDTGLLHRALVWSNTTHICYVDVRAINTNSHSENQTCFISSGTSINYLDTDSHTREVIYADGSDIFKVNIDASPTVRTRITSATEIVTGVAVDWRDKNIYWCQGTTMGKIMMISQRDVFPLITTNLQSPRTLRILPIQNTMVWVSGIQFQYNIEKSQLDGSQRTVILLIQALNPPDDIAIDVTANKVYFIDQDSIKVCGLDGSDLSMLSSYLIYPQNILVYKNHLVTFDNYDKRVESFEKQSPSTPLSFFTLDSLTDFEILDTTTQPEQHGPCDLLNGDCEQICIPVGRNRLCQCEYGFNLDDNRQTCSTVPLLDDFLLVADWTHNKVYQVSLVDNRISALDSGLIQSPSGVACNPLTRELIWGDISLVQRVTVKSTGYKMLANLGEFGSHPDSFAIDYTNGDIYYTAVASEPDGFVGIGVISPNGDHIKLVNSGQLPRAIQLDITEGLVFWTDPGISPGAVLQARLNGSNIQSLNVQMDSPNGIAIDRTAQMLYITDGITDTIHICTYGGNCTVYYTDPGAQLMDIKLDGDYLYYTAWNKVFITKIHKTNSLDITELVTNAELGRLDTICIYNTSSVPTTTVTSISTTTTTPTATASITTATSTRTTHPQLITTPKSTTTTSPVTILIGAGAGLLGLILIVVVVLCVFRRLKSKRSTNGPNYVQNNTPLELPVVYQDPTSRDHHGVLQQQHQQRESTYDSLEDTYEKCSRVDSGAYLRFENPYTMMSPRINSYEQPIIASEMTVPGMRNLPTAPSLPYRPPATNDYLTTLPPRLNSYEQPVMATEMALPDWEGLPQAPPTPHMSPLQSDYFTPSETYRMSDEETV